MSVVPVFYTRPPPLKVRESRPVSSSDLLIYFKTNVHFYRLIDSSKFHYRRARLRWEDTSMYEILTNLVSRSRIEAFVKNYNCSGYFSIPAYQDVIACKLSGESIAFLQSLAVLEYIFSPTSPQEHVLMISQKHNCLQHYFGLISKSVVRFSSASETATFDEMKRRLNNPISRKTDYYSFEEIKDVLEVADRKQFPKFFTIISFEELTSQECAQLLKLGTSDAVLFIINQNVGFKAASFSDKASLEITVLAESHEIHCDNFV